MTTPTPRSRFHTLVIALLALSSGLVGSVIGSIYAAALSTTPAWVGPAVLIASLGLIMVGLLLLPAAVRAVRASRSGG